MNIYDNSIEIYQHTDDMMKIYFDCIKDTVTINFNALSLDTPAKLLEIDINDKVILDFSYDKNKIVTVYSLDGSVYVIKESNSISADYKPHQQAYQFSIENHYEEEGISVKQVNSSSFALFYKGEMIRFVDTFLTNQTLDFSFDFDVPFLNEEEEQVVLSMVSHGRNFVAVRYNPLIQTVEIKKVVFKVVKPTDEFELTLVSQDELLVSQGESKQVINFSKLKKVQGKKLFSFDEVTLKNHDNILSIFSINKHRYYLFLRKNGVFIGKSNHYRITGYKPRMKLFFSKKNVYLFGRHTHYAYNAYEKYEHLYLHEQKNLLSIFKRPFGKLPLLRRYGFFKFPIEKLLVNDRIHNNLFIGDENYIIHNFKFRYQDKKVKTYGTKQREDDLHVLRTNLHGNVTSTIIPFSEEYTTSNRLKIRLAKWSSYFLKFKKKKINLYFEKKSMKADESSFRVFQEVMKEKQKTDNYFVIDKHSEHYPAIKETYKQNIIEKFSFRHYLSIFMANAFVSSELSNHLLNDRLYVDDLRNKLMKVPLVFLQHGIMFAKPVDNPMALGFHKVNNKYNIFKNVISSELEAGEFYKMGYDREDLILTGLATLDHAFLDEGADKIAYMPTYRYWEEGLIYKNEIEETSYYRAIMKIIEAFKKEGLLDRLLIVPHNKFSQFIADNMPEYKHIICDNPSEALKVSKVFITDYSSAIYDAIFRGAYPIFHWEEKDYLIEKYQAIPPVNEENAPGDITMNTEELMASVKKAIETNYKIEDDIMHKYKQINQFDDRKNTERIVTHLKREGIL